MTFLAVFSNILIGAAVILLFLVFVLAVLEYLELDTLIVEWFRKKRNQTSNERKMKL